MYLCSFSFRICLNSPILPPILQLFATLLGRNLRPLDVIIHTIDRYQLHILTAHLSTGNALYFFQFHQFYHLLTTHLRRRLIMICNLHLLYFQPHLQILLKSIYISIARSWAAFGWCKIGTRINHHHHHQLRVLIVNPSLTIAPLIKVKLLCVREVL